MKVAVSTAPRRIPLNVADPSPLLLSEVFYHLRQGRLLRYISRSDSLIAAGILSAAGLAFYTEFAMAVLSGAALSILLVAALYLCWYGRFANLNSERKILCPCCASRMWQFCCKRCKEPVPPLAFMMSGAFLSECPHCGLRLCDRTGTLLAWCSTCSHTEPHPKLLYGKPTHIVVWVTDILPSVGSSKGSWKLIARPSDSRLIVYHRDDSHSASLMYVIHFQKDDLRFDPYVIAQCRMLLVSESLSSAQVDRFVALFPSALFERI